MKLSIVTTLYKSAGTIQEFYDRAVKQAEAVATSVEVVMVDDHSPDESLALALAIMERDPRVVVVELARNFGHHRALMTGLAHAKGDLVFLLDSDLEEEPEILDEFLATMRTEQADVVYGIQRARKGSTIERATGGVFFWLTGLLSDHALPRNVVTARLMTREYVAALSQYQDREFMIAHLWSITGFRQIPVKINKLSISPTTYTLRRRIQMAVKHVTTTSTRLLHAFFYIGLLISLLSACVMIFYIIRYLTNGIGVSGFASLIISVWFFGGLLMLTLGVNGIYIANILSEVRRRPYTLIRRVHRGRDEGQPLDHSKTPSVAQAAPSEQ